MRRHISLSLNVQTQDICTQKFLPRKPEERLDIEIVKNQEISNNRPENNFLLKSMYALLHSFFFEFVSTIIIGKALMLFFCHYSVLFSDR